MIKSIGNRIHALLTQARIVWAFFAIGILFGFFPGCAETPDRPKVSPPKPAIKAPVRAPESVAPPSPPVWPERPVTSQNARSRSVRERKTPSLVRDFSKVNLTLGSPIFIRIFKESKELELWVARGERYVLFKTYPIACMSGVLGPKIREGDNQAPEGFYYVLPSRMKPDSQFHLSFNIGYPNSYDLAHHRTGSALMVHGSWVSKGCFAMTDRCIEEIYTIADYAFNAGQPFFRVHIFPFRMTEDNMRRHAASPHIQFWRNLQGGYDFFEITRRPPDVDVRNQKYVFAFD